MSRRDEAAFDPRVRAALREENSGLRQSRRRRIEWRALQALIDATIESVAA